MPYFARLWGRDSRRRPAPACYGLEALEGRTMLSGTATTPPATNVPTATTLQSVATSAEVGQYVPLVATVTNASTSTDANAAKAQAITGKVEFLTESSNPIVLGTVNLNNAGQASLSTNLLKNPGPYQIEAEFLPANNNFTGSTSAPIAVTMTPTTVNAPTATILQATTRSIETGESISLTATVQNANSSLADGVVKFVTVGRQPVVLGKVGVGTFGQQVSLTTHKLKKVGEYQVEAEFLPNTNRFATSTSAPITVTVTPLTAATFRVTPVVRHGQLGTPLSFAVTALNSNNQPLTNYVGTVVFTSPTDSWTVFPKSVYASLHLSPPPPESAGLASFNPQSYTFSPADHGSHTFLAAVAFGKAAPRLFRSPRPIIPKSSARQHSQSGDAGPGELGGHGDTTPIGTTIAPSTKAASCLVRFDDSTQQGLYTGELSHGGRQG